MSRTLEKNKKPRPQPSKAEPPAPPKRKESNRDLVEQVVVAFILAFLIRGFEAEAFVIPTGSMAPTLYGQHKEVTCPECGEVYAVNASEEDDGSSRLNPFRENTDRKSHQIAAATCVNCRYVATKLDEAPSFKGDRILVMKFLYDLPFLPGGGGPKRWDVVVFHYPEEPEVNYIKRMVGLPDEDLRIYFGNILTRPRGSDKPFRLERKPLRHQDAMQMMVWNDAHRPKAFASFPDWQRWKPRGASWKETSEGTFETAAANNSDGSGWSELRYRNLVPDPQQWKAVLGGSKPETPPRATLISDFYSYNTGITADRRADASEWYQPHWVGDLTVSGQIQPTSNQGKLRLELVEGGVSNRCEFDLATGMATLFHGDLALGAPVATRLKDLKAHDVAFANVDDRLTLWVDGTTPFGEGLTYDDGFEKHPAPTSADLDPVGIATQGGAGAKVSGLVLKRDIYYTLDPGGSDSSALGLGLNSDPEKRIAETFDLLADPARFAALADLKWQDYPIAPGRYMMLGDNSPRSKDSRAWTHKDRYNPDYPEMGWDKSDRASWEVPESMLIGKAFFVYWPHGKPFGPDIRLNRDFRIPFRPYFERMKWIR